MSRSAAIRIALSGDVAVTCRCGHSDSLSAFSRTPIGGDLPPDIVQCPACGLAVSRRYRRECEFLPDGRILDAGGYLERVPTRL